MSRKGQGFDPFRFARTTEGQLVVGFFVLLYVVGGGLIWGFYGSGGAILGWACMTGGLLAFLLLYGLVSLIGWWANREDY
jgi:hypothetical protein